MRKKIVSAEDRQRIVKLYIDQDMTLKEIAARFSDISHRIVRNVLAESKIRVRKQGQRYPKKTAKVWEHVEAVIRLYTEEKLSPRVIAKRFGVSTAPIRDILDAYGVSKRTLKEARRYRWDKYGYEDMLVGRCLELRSKDETIQDIAATLNIEPKEVYKILTEQNALISRPKPKWEQRKKGIESETEV